MNKYQEALNEFESVYRNITLDDDLTNDKRDTLQELVDKETPMKPEIPNNSSLSFCVICKNSITHYVGSLAKENFKYCKICGQKIDWSNE